MARSSCTPGALRPHQSALEIDLTGQVNGEVAGGSYVARSGGAPDSSAPANQSPDGVRSCFCPRAHRRSALGSGRDIAQRAGIIVTERGAADLRGCSLRERERRLRAIS